MTDRIATLIHEGGLERVVEHLIEDELRRRGEVIARNIRNLGVATQAEADRLQATVIAVNRVLPTVRRVADPVLLEAADKRLAEVAAYLTEVRDGDEMLCLPEVSQMADDLTALLAKLEGRDPRPVIN